MTKEYWKEREGESVQTLGAMAEKGKACLWLFIQWEAKVRREVFAFEEELRKTFGADGEAG